MPIKPENKDKYPDNWFEIRERIRKRAGDRCEFCGVHNHAMGYRDKEGVFHRDGGNILHDLAGEGLSYPSLEPISYSEAKELADFLTML